MDRPRPAQGAVCIPQIAPFVNVYLPFGFQRFINLARSALHDVAKSFRIRARERYYLILSQTWATQAETVRMQSNSRLKWIIVTLFAGAMLNGPLTASPLLAEDDSLKVQDVEIPGVKPEFVDQQLKQIENAPPIQPFPWGVVVVLAIVGLFIIVLLVWLLVSKYKHSD